MNRTLGIDPLTASLSNSFFPIKKISYVKESQVRETQSLRKPLMDQAMWFSN